MAGRYPNRTDLDMVQTLLQQFRLYYYVNDVELVYMLGYKSGSAKPQSWRTGRLPAGEKVANRLKVLATIADQVARRLGPDCKDGHVSLFFEIKHSTLEGSSAGEYFRNNAKCDKSDFLPAIERFAEDVKSGRISLPEKPTHTRYSGPINYYREVLDAIATLRHFLFTPEEIGGFIGQDGLRILWILDKSGGHISLLEKYQLELAAKVARQLERIHGPHPVRDKMRTVKPLHNHKVQSIVQFIASQTHDGLSRKAVPKNLQELAAQLASPKSSL